ncbi:MAG: cell envelope integrity protein TolA [Pseudomonadales bacterium]|nr:cell envelope integrity protein TolA [Pseudomonadales bacterium]
MNFTAPNILACLLAAAVHGLVVFLLLTNWHNTEPDTVKIDKIYALPARVIHENPIKAEKKRQLEKNQQAAIRRQAQKAKLQADNLARINREQIKAEALKKMKAAEAAQKALAEQQLDRSSSVDDVDKAQLAKQQALKNQQRKEWEDALGLEIEAEQIGIVAITDDEKAKAFVAQIQRKIIQNWSRPPSARNGMQALLRVFLVPTGEVVNVTILESSSNDAFDQSAMLAVRKARLFIVPAKARQFDRNFRQFEVLFRPDDLRL